MTRASERSAALPGAAVGQSCVVARPRVAALLAVCVLVAGLWPGLARAQSGKKEARSFDLRLTNLERAVDRLGRDFAEPVAVMRNYPLETRLIEAKILYELENFEGASVMLLDLVDNPEFQRKSDYPSTVLMLGRSLMALGNARAAKRYIAIAARGADPAVVDDARYHLINIALDAQDIDALRDLVGKLSVGSSSRTRYALGKALIQLEEYPQAVEALTPLSQDAELGAKVRYYIGVAHTAQKDYAAGKQVFEALVDPSARDVDPEVRDLGWLALGRLRMEEGDLVGSVSSYQHIGRHRAAYELALYEMAWAYIKAEQYDKALGTIDALLLTVKDPDLDVEAHTLRGRLNIYLNDYASAVESFEKIVDRFAPIRNELDRFARDPQNVHRYFAWLLSRKTEDTGLNEPLTSRTAQWVESSPEMKRVATVFDSLSQQRREIQETQAIAEELERIVSAQSRVELFPELKDGWTRALVLENQLIALSSAVLDYQYQLAKPRLNDRDLAEVEALVAWRKQLEQRFRRVPMTYTAYERRHANVDERFLDLKRQAFMVGQRLKEVRRQLLAIERFVNDRQFGEDTEKYPPEDERELRSAIDEEKARLGELYEELSGLEQEVEIEAQIVGTNDLADQGESDLKAALMAAHKKEGLNYDKEGVRVADIADAFSTLAELRERIWSSVEQLESIIAAIDGKVGEKVDELYGLIRGEALHLEQYALEMTGHESEGRAIGVEVGEELFARAREKMKEVVLKAEVGLIDVAWQQKREHTEAIQKLNRERNKKTNRLHETLNELTTGEIEVKVPDSAPAPQPGPPPAGTSGAETSGAPEDVEPATEPEPAAEPAPAPEEGE